MFHLLKCYARFLSQSLGFSRSRRCVKEVLIKLLQATHLRCSKINLWLKDYVAMSMGVSDRLLQVIIVQQVTVCPELYLAPVTKLRQGAKDCGVVPSIGLALKPLYQRLQCSANTPTIIALNK